MKLNINQTAQAFGVSTMTIWYWRRGLAGREPLQTLKPPETRGQPVFIDSRTAQAYAKKYGLEFTLPSAESLKIGKPGPKPRKAKALGALG